MTTCRPRHLSDIPEGTDISTAEHGATALGLGLLPQGENVAGVLEAKDNDNPLRPKYRRVVVQQPRRSAKTTSIAATLIGRCATVPGYKVISTAQTRTIARLTWMEVATVLDMSGFAEMRMSNGSEELRWSNGSTWRIAPPKASGFRSQAADAIWIDEAGELSEEQTRDLVEGALPLLDTRPMGQFIVSGTPAKTRAGLLWEELEGARAGKPGRGIVDYSATYTDDLDDEETWWRVHPGLASGLTSIDIMRERHAGMSGPSWAREYMCLDPVSAALAAIDPEAWTVTTVPEHLAIPTENVAIAFATAREDAAGAIAVAWYTPEGHAAIQLIDYRPGISWMPRALVKALAERPNATVTFDSIGSNVSIYTTLQRLAPPAHVRRVKGVGAREAAAGVTTILSNIAECTLLHAADRDLDAAAEGASFRWLGDSRLWGRRTSTADVAPLEAAGLALLAASGMRPHTKLTVAARRF